MKSFVLLSLFLFTGSVYAEQPLATMPEKRVLQDPKTKVIYYLESDLCHIAALSPDGRFLWCCEVVHPSISHRARITAFGFWKDQNFIGVDSNPTGFAWGIIDKKTGVYTSLGED